ncbi:hypothetical protein BH11VER1_BH11VER1_02110 [soil metagenome]
MPCCTKILALLLLPILLSQAQEGPVLDATLERKQIDASELDPRVRAAAATLEEMRDGEKFKPTPEQLSVVCEACGLHPSIRGFAAEAKPFPGTLLVELLAHPRFAVRMGALEILEEHTNQDSTFDPWQPLAEKSQEALKKWQAWAAGKVPETELPAVLDEAKMRGYLVDLVATDVAKQERAFEALASAGMKSVAFLEQYLHDTPQLAEGTRARIKQTQYRLVLIESLPVEAARLARDLVYGTRDQKLAAMQPLPRCREKAVPILAEFLPDGDALIREAAMDAIILAGGQAVYDLVQERLKTEVDENVIHAVLRRVSTESSVGATLIASFMTSKNEDLTVAALNALSDGKSSAGKSGVMGCIGDPRWRVRVAALEYAGKLSVTEAEPAVMAAFSDKDEFVRYAAMKAAADMKLSGALPLITKMALKDDTLLAPATDAIVRMGKPLPDELVKALPDKPGEALLGVLRAFGKRAGHDGEQIDWSKLNEKNPGDSFGVARQALQIVRTLARHRDPDVSMTAIHLLSGMLLNVEDKQLVYQALQKADPDGKVAIIEGMTPGPFDFRESFAEEAGEGGAASAGDPVDVFERILREPVPRNKAQEAVYAAFGIPLNNIPVPAENGTAKAVERTWQPMEKEFYELLMAAMMQRDNAELSFNAAAQLAFGGNRKAIGEIHQMLPKLEAHQRARLAEFLNEDTRLTATKSGQALLRSLLQDESPEVRKDAVSATLRRQSPERLRLLLDEVNRPEGNLRAVNAYGYSLTNFADDSKSRNVIQTWSTEVLGSSQSRDDAKTLALVLLGTTGSAQALPQVEAALGQSSIWQRRAAWRALLRLDRPQFEAKVNALARDSSPRVREVLAAAFRKSESDVWRVWFGERDWDTESMPYRQRSKVFTLPDHVESLLVELSRDPDVYVKIHAMFTLLSHGRDVESMPLREAISSLQDEERRSLLPPFLQESYRQLSPRYGFLLDQTQEKWFNSDTWRAINKQLNPDSTKKTGMALASFSSLVQTTASVNAEAKPEAGPEPPSQAVSAQPQRVLFFYKPGCKDCERTRDMLRVISKTQPLEVEDYNIEMSDGAQRNETLCARFKVSPELHQVTPAVFTQAGALVKTAITFNALQRIIEKASEETPDPLWHQVGEQERAVAGAQIAERFSGFSIGWVTLAGLLDGINPCAFATIIFFMSYLRIARRSPREILMVGAVFILAVFLAYFAVGLGLSQLMAKLEAFSWVRLWLNRLLAFVALMLAWLSFRDGLRALRGQFADATLQLPEFLKTRIRGVIRTQARSSHFVMAAFASGIIISLLELACTGQVYLPTIVYMMKQGSLSAVGYLLLYNVSFVLPLIVIFVLAWLGMKNEALIDFQKRHTATVRFGTALLFLALWIVLLVA